MKNSRVKRLKERDQDTMFFDGDASARKQTNRITVHEDKGSRNEDREKIIYHIANFYKNLYSKEK